MVDIMAILGQSAIFQILNKKRGRPEEEKVKLAQQIESSMKKFNNNNGRLSVDDYFNVIKLQNGIEVSKDEIRRLVADLDMDRNYKISIKDFMTTPIMSEAVFLSMDKNKDGFVSKGELKLAQRNVSMAELNALIDEIDTDGDGKLTFEEVKQVALRLKANKPTSSPAKNSSGKK